MSQILEKMEEMNQAIMSIKQENSLLLQTNKELLGQLSKHQQRDSDPTVANSISTLDGIDIQLVEDLGDKLYTESEPSLKQSMASSKHRMPEVTPESRTSSFGRQVRKKFSHNNLIEASGSKTIRELHRQVKQKVRKSLESSHLLEPAIRLSSSDRGSQISQTTGRATQPSEEPETQNAPTPR